MENPVELCRLLESQKIYTCHEARLKSWKGFHGNVNPRREKSRDGECDRDASFWVAVNTCITVVMTTRERVTWRKCPNVNFMQNRPCRIFTEPDEAAYSLPSSEYYNGNRIVITITRCQVVHASSLHIGTWWLTIMAGYLLALWLLRENSQSKMIPNQSWHVSDFYSQIYVKNRVFQFNEHLCKFCTFINVLWIFIHCLLSIFVKCLENENRFFCRLLIPEAKNVAFKKFVFSCWKYVTLTISLDRKSRQRPYNISMSGKRAC